jgi:FkbM family methyltransferase
MHNQYDFSVDRYKLLKKSGFYPKTALDVGANTGQWYSMFNPIFPDTEILSVEGNPLIEEKLKEINPNYLLTLLGKEKGEATFFLQHDHCSGGSIYKETTSFYENCREFTLPINTLDSYNKEFDLIKIDVQGAELDVIKGGLKTVLNSSIIQLELSILEFNKNAPPISEVISYLYHLDFAIYDVLSHFYWNDRLNQIDIIFINNRKLNHLLKI